MKLLLSSVLLVVLNLGLQAQTDHVTVTIQNGPIVGQTIDAASNNLVNQFLGIPYARPPIGKLRFRKPVPADRWNESIQALEWPNNCHQMNEMIKPNIPYNNKNFTEDCLYLNVWSPDVTVDDDHLSAVVVYIHGGSLIVGGIGFDLFNGKILSLLGDVVVVTVNYRMSTFGFLYSDAVDDIKGNQGLWDQALALEWVNDNIRYFGGDPKKITLMGNSAGSWTVSSHILSPVSRNLFRNAIMFSGAALSYAIREPDFMVQTFLKGIRKVGCANEQDTSITQLVIECLEGLDETTIGTIPFFDNDSANMLTVDGQFFPEHPVDMLAHGNHKINFTLIASTVEEEGSFILDLDKKDPRFRRSNPESITLDEAKSFLIDLISSKLLKKPVDSERITKFYFTGLNARYDQQNLFRRHVGIAYGDFLLACPTIEFAKQVFKSSPDSVSVFQFQYKFDKEKFLCSEWMGASYCDELYPEFGTELRYTDEYPYRNDKISDIMINIISSFAHYGQPGFIYQDWLKYYMERNGNILEIVAPYFAITNEATNYESYKFDLKKYACETIWNKYLFQKI